MICLSVCFHLLCNQIASPALDIFCLIVYILIMACFNVLSELDIVGWDLARNVDEETSQLIQHRVSKLKSALESPDFVKRL